MTSKRPQPDDASNSKRRRVEMPQPEGFIVGSSKDKQAKTRDSKPLSVPVFQSGFDIPGSESSSGLKKPRVSSGLTRLSKDTPVSRASGSSNLSRVQLNFASNVPQMGRNKPPSKPPSTLKLVPIQLRPNPPLSQSAKPVSVRAPPPPPIPPQPRLAAVEPGPSQVVPPKSIRKPPSNLVIPTFNTNKPPSTRTLKSLQAPPIPVASTSDNVVPRKYLKTISETGAAKLVADHAEFAAILLHDQRPDLVLRDESEQEKVINRGLEQSPDKNGKTVKRGGGGAGGGGFVRGGLAARASQFFEQTHTGTNLWQKEMDRRKQPKSVTGANSMDTRIVKVAHRVNLTGARNTGLVTILALCRVLPGSRPNSFFRHDKLYHVMFLFLSVDNKLHDPQRYTEGCTVRIFQPWHDVSSSDTAGSQERSRTRLPTSLPLPSTHSPGPSQELGVDAPVDDKAVFCSRFILLS